MFTSTMLFLMSNILFVILHTTNINSFPKALSADEERKYLELFKTHGDKDARTKLIEHNLRLVAHVIKKYYSAGHDPDDLISVSPIKLVYRIASVKTTFFIHILYISRIFTLTINIF